MRVALDSNTLLSLAQSHFLNPILETGADPWIIQKDDLYYYCFSDNKSSIFISVADNPTELGAAEKHLVWRAPTAKLYSHETWAPELHNLDGRWYIYFAASNGKNSTHRMYVLEADDVLGPYRFKGQISPATDRWAIDGTVLEMDDGERYFLWSGWDGKTNIQQNIYISRMLNPWTLATLQKPALKLRAVKGSPKQKRDAVLDSERDMEVITDEAGLYCLEIAYRSETASMHRLEVNDETHYGLHYGPTGSTNWQTHYETIELKKGRNVLRFAPGIGSVAVRAMQLKAYGCDRIAISTPEFHWEKLGGPPYINEGPQILKRDGLIHVVYSASGSWTDDYQLGLLTFKGGDVLNKRNWTKKGPVFKRSETVFGPGHASFIRFQDRDWIVYHAAKHSGAAWNRNVRMQPFAWDDEGHPLFGAPHAITVPQYIADPGEAAAELREQGA